MHTHTQTVSCLPSCDGRRRRRRRSPLARRIGNIVGPKYSRPNASAPKTNHNTSWKRTRETVEKTSVECVAICDDRNLCALLSTRLCTERTDRPRRFASSSTHSAKVDTHVRTSPVDGRCPNKLFLALPPERATRRHVTNSRARAHNDEFVISFE